MLNQIIIFILLLSYQVQPSDDVALKILINKSPYILIAEVISVGESPKCWSGYIETRQSVKYEVLQVLKGNLDEKIISVKHTLIKHSKLSDKEFPQLSSEIFKSGHQLILFIKAPEHQNDGRDEYIFDEKEGYIVVEHSKYYICTDSSDGAFLIDYNQLDHIKDLINEK